MKETADNSLKQIADLQNEVEILTEKCAKLDMTKLLQEKDEEIIALKEDIAFVRRANQNLLKKNEELEERMESRATRELYGSTGSEIMHFYNSSDEEIKEVDLKK